MKKSVLNILLGVGLGAAAVILSKKENRRLAIRSYNSFMDLADEKLNDISETTNGVASHRKIPERVIKIKDLLN